MGTLDLVLNYRQTHRMEFDIVLKLNRRQEIAVHEEKSVTFDSIGF